VVVTDGGISLSEQLIASASSKSATQTMNHQKPIKSSPSHQNENHKNPLKRLAKASQKVNETQIQQPRNSPFH